MAGLYSVGCFLGDLAGVEELLEGEVNGAHALFAPDLHGVQKRGGVAFSNNVGHRDRVEDELDGEHSFAVGAREQPLAENAAQRLREHGARGGLLACREEVDQLVDTLHRVHCRHGGEDQVAGLGGRDREARGLVVPQVADHNDVRVLAQRATQRCSKARRMGSALSLRDLAELWREKELHRILNADDVLFARRVDQVDQREHGGRLAGPQGARDED